MREYLRVTPRIDFLIVTVSGARCLVRAESATHAALIWDCDAANGDAEPRRDDARPATMDEVSRIGGTEHDYR